MPEAFEDQRRAEDASAGDDALALGVSAQDGVLVREAAERMEQGIELTGGEQLIERAKR